MREARDRFSHNPREVSKVIKEITGKWNLQTEVINNKNGKTLVETDEILRGWAEYCDELYTKPQPEDHPWGPTGKQGTEPEPTRHEMDIALKHIRNNKSPGIHGIAIEMWKAAGEEGVTLIWNLCVKIWKAKGWPIETAWC